MSTVKPYITGEGVEREEDVQPRMKQEDQHHAGQGAECPVARSGLVDNRAVQNKDHVVLSDQNVSSWFLETGLTIRSR
jgi:hypothetical protein